MAEVLPFPPARRVDFVRRQVAHALTMRPIKGEQHLARQVDGQRACLIAKGVDPEIVSAACSELEGALRSEMWRWTFEGSGGGTAA